MKTASAELVRYTVQTCALAACYFIAAKVGLAFAIPPGNATVVWPPSGIALAAVVLLGFRIWPGIWIGSFAVNLTTGVGLGASVAFASGNTLEAVVAAYLIRHFLDAPYFQRIKDAFLFAGIGAISSVLAATCGVTALIAEGRIGTSEYAANWSTWWLGDLAGQIVFAPLIIALAGRQWGKITSWRMSELACVFALQVLLSCLIFGGWLPERFSENLLYLPMVVLIWVGLRFRLAEVTASTLLFSAAAIWGTSRGVGVYSTEVLHHSLFHLQILLHTYALTGLVFCSIVSSRRTAEASSRLSQEELQKEIKSRGRMEKWFQQLMLATPDALVVSNSDGEILLVNHTAETLFLYEQDELIGQAIEVLLPERHREGHRQHRRYYNRSPYVRMMGTGVELTACRKNGTEFPAEIALGPMQTEDGLVIFSAIRDVTARKVAERALRESEERFSVAVEGADVGIWDWDLRTDAVFFSPRWKSILGYENDEIQNELSEWENRLHAEDRDRALETVNDYLEGRTTEYELEHRLQHKDGSYRWILARGAAVRDEDGHPYRMAGSHMDVTERKFAALQLRRQQAQLIAAEEIQSHLLPQSPPAVEGLQVAGRCFPAEFAAGDSFDFLFLKNGAFVPVIGDVCGHGVGPAILMAYLHSHLRARAPSVDCLEELITRANGVLVRESARQRFVTFLALQIDPTARLCSYMRCGHPPGFIMNMAGEVTTTMDAGSIPLGILDDAKFSLDGPIPLQDGDVIVLLTDGILEAESPDGIAFGMERTIGAIRDHRGASADDMIGALRQSVCEHAQRDTFNDDITMVIAKVDGARADAT